MDNKSADITKKKMEQKEAQAEFLRHDSENEDEEALEGIVLKKQATAKVENRTAKLDVSFALNAFGIAPNI